MLHLHINIKLRINNNTWNVIFFTILEDIFAKLVGKSLPLLIWTLKMLGFLKVVFFWNGGGVQFEPSFIFQEELIQCQYNFIKLLNNLFNVGWR